VRAASFFEVSSVIVGRQGDFRDSRDVRLTVGYLAGVLYSGPCKAYWLSTCECDGLDDPAVHDGDLM
jgi:hypothetical protein